MVFIGSIETESFVDIYIFYQSFNAHFAFFSLTLNILFCFFKMYIIFECICILYWFYITFLKIKMRHYVFILNCVNFVTYYGLIKKYILKKKNYYIYTNVCGAAFSFTSTFWCSRCLRACLFNAYCSKRHLRTIGDSHCIRACSACVLSRIFGTGDAHSDWERNTNWSKVNDGFERDDDVLFAREEVCSNKQKGMRRRTINLCLRSIVEQSFVYVNNTNVHKPSCK